MKGPLPADVATVLHRFGLERDRLRTALARRLDLPVADLDALEHLELAGPLSQRELAERLLLTSGAVTVLVDRLEAAGLVSRQPHPSDRRITLVQRVPDARLPEVPELQRHHAAIREAATVLEGAGRSAVVDFLTEITDSAAGTTQQLWAASTRRSRAPAGTSAGSAGDRPGPRPAG